jgi:histone-lysine N-methyltransferase SETDB1
MTNLQQDKLQNDVFPRNLPDITPQPVQPQQFQQQQGQQQLQQQTGNQDWVRKKYNLHKCSLRCLGEATDDPQSHKGCNPLLIPIYCGWERQVSKPSLTNVRKHVNYRAPCARRLRTLDEIQSFLILTDSQLTIDLFCFDPNVHTQYEFIPAKTFCDIKDISYGNEAVPVSCVNGLDRLYPDYVEYSTKRHPGDDVKLNLNSAFMVCCDCEDMCLDSTKCACRKLTIEASAALNKDAHPMDNAG